MDRLLYVAMGGAKQLLDAQGIVSHNLANASTHGYRADLHAFSSYLVQGPGYGTRVNVVAEQLGFDPRPGVRQETGRALDVAIDGAGWLAVQAPDGREAYTRAGNLRVNPSGVLETAAGHPVLGDTGPMTLPAFDQMAIGPDGTVTVVPEGLGPESLVQVGRLKLVDPPVEDLVKGVDGLVHLREGAPLPPADAAVRVAGGALEASNVNVAEALVEMIQVARAFEMQVRLMNTANDNDSALQQLLRAG